LGAARNQKDSLAVHFTRDQVPSPTYAMTKSLLLFCLALALSLSGCTLFKKSAKPKESSAIASETEDSLMKRFIDKRAGELAAQGMAADAARAQATQEFRERYAFTSAAKK
jgi:hypothetical protein